MFSDVSLECALRWTVSFYHPQASEFDSHVLEFGCSLMQIGFQSKIKTRIVNSVDPDETACL